MSVKARRNAFLSTFFIAVVLLLTTACDARRHTLYQYSDGSGTLFLSRLTSMLPTFGPCGPVFSEDSYEISMPRTNGKIDSRELHIILWDSNSIQYSGYILFISPTLIDVQLFRKENGKDVPLTINGRKRIRREDNRLAMMSDTAK